MFIDKKYIKDLITLALPILLGNIGIILIHAGDCLVAGRYSTDTLAAVSIASSIHAIISMGGVGLLLSISPLLSNIRGAKQSAKKYFYPTLKFAAFVSVAITILTFLYIPLIKYMGYSDSLTQDIITYTKIVAFSVFGITFHLSLKEFLQAYEIVLLPNLVMLASVIINLGLNVFFVFGSPQLGVAGLALASLISRLMGGLYMVGFCLYKFRFKKFDDKKYYKQIIKIGLPISMAIMIEFLSFNSIAILLGRFSSIYAAAENIIVTLVNTSFMFPLALSNAIAVKIGFSNGAKNYKEMVGYIKNGIFLSILFMSFASIIFATCSKQLIQIFTTDNTIITMAIPVMYIVAAFQVSDGLQVAISGALKGLKKTKIIMLSNFFAYLIIGVTSGYICALHFEHHLFAFWCAFASSSFLLSTILAKFLHQTFSNIQYQK